MKIVHVYNQLDPRNGGPPHVIAGLVAAQVAAGHEVVLISEDSAGQANVDDFIQHHVGQPIVRHSIQPKLFISQFTRKQFQHALDGADIAHLHGVWPIVSMMASRICRELGIPYVFAPHGSLHRAALMEKAPKKLVGMWALGYRQYIRDAAALHALNENEATGARQPFYSGVSLPTQIEVIPNGVGLEIFEKQTNPGAVQTLIPTLGHAPYILYLSRLHPGKGCDLLSEAFTRIAMNFPEVHLVFVGQDQGGQAQAERTVRKAGLAHRTHFVGPVFDDRKFALYKSAKVFCLPSRHEGFSMAITEAMACSCPIVATKTCFFPELTTYDCGFETEVSASGLAAGLSQVLSNEAAATAMGARAHKLVRSDYTWPRIAAKTIALYERCLDI